MKAITTYKIEKISEIRNLIISSIPNKFVLEKDDKGNWIVPNNTTVFHLKRMYACSKEYAAIHPFYSLLAKTRVNELHLLPLNIVPENSPIRKILLTTNI